MIQTRLTEDMSTTHTQVGISTGKVTHTANKTIVWFINEAVIISAYTVGRGYLHSDRDSGLQQSMYVMMGEQYYIYLLITLSLHNYCLLMY